MQVDFYHLTRQPLEHVLPRIAERVVAGGGRLLVVSRDEEQRQEIDRFLWTYAPESFLPHGSSGGADDAGQPVLITPNPEPANAARHVAIVDGEWRDAALGFDRAFHMFGEESITVARTAWKALADRIDVERRYWKQNETGKWEQAG